MKAGVAKRLPMMLWAIALLLIAVFGLRSLVGDVYPVASSSMEPTLRPGERVFMRYGNQGLKRFDLVVVLDPGGRTIVKRLVGLPNESVTIVPSGNLLIDGKPLPFDAAGSALIPVFDSELHDDVEYFAHGGSLLDPWERVGDRWRLEGREVLPGTYTGMLRFNKNINDDRLDAAGRRVLGSNAVGDLALECEVRLLDKGGQLRFEVVEGAEIYSLLIHASDPPGVGWSLLSSSSGLEPLASGRFELPLGEWTRVGFRNVDDSLVASVGETSAHWSGPPTPATGAAGRGSRVRLGGEACRAEFRRIRILRDLHYTGTGRGTYAIHRQLQLDADEIFVLGDNSPASQDSRELGPLSIHRVLGVPQAVVWPLGQARLLGR